ncbi:MAG: hypothetical protein QM754_07515 [Tepidisphaeraceae bacterium]
MQELTTRSPMPLPEIGVTIRAATPDDIPFMDALQKLHTKQVGWMPKATFEGKIKLGHVLIAEIAGERVGYCIGNDQYFKRDDVGIIYQMNVLPGKQRAFVGASLLKAQFERSAYGCKLYCCWCAGHRGQPVLGGDGLRAAGICAGSEKKSRVHIFWQKRIRSGDTTTPWWFPSKTAGGSIREDRIVLPIPPGTHWSDAKPMILPAAPESVERGLLIGEKKPRAPKRPSTIEIPQTPSVIRRNGLMFDIPQPGEPLPEAKPTKVTKAKPEKVKRVCDPRLVSAARELRDRWLEEINATPLLPGGKYEVSRAMEDRTHLRIESLPQKVLAA